MEDVEGFDEFYRRSRQRLLGFVYLHTGDVTEAQDSVQEAYARAWQRWSTVREHADPEAWVRVVATRIAISKWRSLRTRAKAYIRHGVVESSPAPSSATLEVVTALRKLPEAQRTAITLFYLLDLSVEEVARATGAPTGTVKARLARGREKLAGLLRTDAREVADA
ncbi:RNA polymerase sigma-70 factor (ECF subfamily) [Allocatelliglobosispora scoriae]|uniref:RNA polymerase sigma-70 factor (ECF subfamily) n=1 Tax=Allocatelliglobosispora scoriae TaxID=643052 RepID=A0A841BS18_9ACTN|nr:SigE family RNA polymerase sigma factor [Allocatelliglobosispora scoriae]MBB5869522.1 RNA polymerase sigma-70 factor (ECF subfamily) [Allocatelliglobosispora scoriae]